jgi:hypothetical protein
MGKKNVWREDLKTNERLIDVKRMLCRKISTAILADRRTYKGAAVWLGTSRATISRINREQVNQLSFDQLFLFLVRLRPFFEVLITANRHG